MVGKCASDSQKYFSPIRKRLILPPNPFSVMSYHFRFSLRNILLLDEPTNHLDLDSVMWLEKFLPKQNIPMVIVSHDREFLDQVCNKIVDMEDGATVTYNNCNYSKFLERRRDRLNEWKEKFDKQVRFIRDEERFLKRAKSDESITSQTKSREMSLEKLKNGEGLIPQPPKDKKFRFRFPDPPRCGDKILEVSKLTHGFGDGKYKVLFEDVDYEIERGDRIGFIGPNGSGKSTMMKIIMGLIEPQKGYTEICSPSVVSNYYAQNQADALDLDKTVLECVQENAPTDVSFTDVRSLLGQFMFKGDDVYKKIRVLSGGEKARVALCRMMLTPANLLLLDEVITRYTQYITPSILTGAITTLLCMLIQPTNHLDITSKEVLEDALLAYTGSVLIISHDRYFMSQVVNTIFSFHDKTVERFDCDYHDYMLQYSNDENLEKKITSRYVAGM